MIQNDIYSYSVYISLPRQLCLIACFVKILKTFTFVPVHILVPVNISYLFSLNISSSSWCCFPLVPVSSIDC